MDAIKIDLSVAAILEMEGIAHAEIREMDFEAETDWQGTYELKVFNSRKKNEERTIGNAITTDGKVLTWLQDPTNQELKPGKHYFEITDTEAKVIIIKAEIDIAL